MDTTEPKTDLTVDESRAITAATMGFTPREVAVYAAGFLATRHAREDGDRRVLAERERCAGIVERLYDPDGGTASAMLEAIRSGEG